MGPWRKPLVLLVGAALTGPAFGAETWDLPPPMPEPRPAAITSKHSWDVGRICDGIKTAATEHGVPADFFTRLIWKESRFDIRAVSPVGAQGIAQFMPGTAKLRGLADPFDPAQALPASASFLADLKGRFGNWGLAAAAYNGGPGRVSKFVKKRGGLAYETRDYVQSITYRSAEWFRENGRELEHRPLDPKLGFDEACRKIPIVETRTILAAAARHPWSVQVAAGITRSAAQRSLNRARKRYGKLIGGRPASIRRHKLGSVRRYVARIGVPTRTQARKICAQIQSSRGHCVVRRN